MTVILTHPLADYDPPAQRRASLAAGVAPLVVLAMFTLLVARVVDATVAFAWFAAATVWVVHEMNAYQRTIDAYNADYVHRHLAWRSAATLRALAECAELHGPTREFIAAHLRARRTVLRDGQWA